MNAYEIALLADRVTGIFAAILAFGLIIGYVRVLFDESPLVRHISCSTVLLALACGTETLRVRDTGSVNTQVVGMIFNLVVFYACYRGLRAIHRMVPVEQRDNYNWIIAPLYPPWGWASGIHRFRSRWQDRLDRRNKQKPIDFPDRRRKK